MLNTSKRKAVYGKLKEAIASGSYPPGSRLPNEPELAEKLGVSRLTLRHVLAQLERENTLIRVKGQGTFVKDAHDGRIRILVIMANIPNFTQEATLLNELYKVGEAHNALLEPVEPAIVSNLSDNDIKALFDSERYQGMIYISFNLDAPEEMRPIWKKLHIPSVFFFFNSLFTPRRMPEHALVINCDVPGMIREALTYLSNCGHRKAALLLNGNINCVPFEKAADLLKECRMDHSDDMILPCKKTGASNWQEQLVRLLKTQLPPTAICCGSSVMALKIYSILRENGIRPAEDMAVLAVGQTPLGAGLLTPSLTTVFCQWQEFAETAWQYLLNAMLSRTAVLSRPRELILKNYLFERQSTVKTIFPVQSK